MNYAKWETGVPGVIRDDLLWTPEAYRLSLFLADLSWKDAKKISSERITRSISEQLHHSAGSITQIIRLLSKLVPEQRRYIIKEKRTEYIADTNLQEIPF